MQVEVLKGFLASLRRLTGFNPAASMYEDIVNNNYSPIYDNRGQIIGTINPETGQLGKGSRPIDTGAISSTDSDLKAFKYNQFADRNLAGGGVVTLNLVALHLYLTRQVQKMIQAKRLRL